MENVNSFTQNEPSNYVVFICQAKPTAAAYLVLNIPFQLILTILILTNFKFLKGSLGFLRVP